VRGRLEFETTFSVDHVDQFRRLLLHLDHWGLDPVGDWELKISIMPTTVPNRPISGLIVAMVPSVVKKRSSSCATALPASSIASFMT